MRHMLAALVMLGAGCSTDFFVGQDPTATETSTPEPTSSTATPPPADPDSTGTAAPATSSSSADSVETTSDTTDAMTSSTTGEGSSSTTEPSPTTTGSDPCDGLDEESCFGEAPQCAWNGRGCITDPCFEEAECSELGEEACFSAEPCFWLGPPCFLVECVPCEEIETMEVCIELPNCEWIEEFCVS